MKSLTTIYVHAFVQVINGKEGKQSSRAVIVVSYFSLILIESSSI